MTNEDIRKWCYEELRALLDTPRYARGRAILALVHAADTHPWLDEAAEALGESHHPAALTWTQIIAAIHELRAERDEWRKRAEAAESSQEDCV